MKSTDFINSLHQLIVSENMPDDIKSKALDIAYWLQGQEMYKLQLAMHRYPDLNFNEKTLLSSKDKLNAVKSYKFRTGCKLITAKEQVEKYMYNEYGVIYFTSPD